MNEPRGFEYRKADKKPMTDQWTGKIQEEIGDRKGEQLVYLDDDPTNPDPWFEDHEFGLREDLVNEYLELQEDIKVLERLLEWKKAGLEDTTEALDMRGYFDRPAARAEKQREEEERLKEEKLKVNLGGV